MGGQVGVEQIAVGVHGDRGGGLADTDRDAANAFGDSSMSSKRRRVHGGSRTRCFNHPWPGWIPMAHRRTAAHFFPDMGDNMMVKSGWHDVAERIHGWLDGQGL
jgi:hypothetical protein